MLKLNEFSNIKINNDNILLGFFSNKDINLKNDYSIIPPEQIQEINKYKKESDRRKRLIARVNAYRYLYENYQVRDFSLTMGDFGKLSLKKYPKIYFSFSYSKDFILIGLSTKELGVDIEYIDENLNVEQVSKIVMHSDEYYHYSRLNNKKKRDFFFKVFNLKEAIIKNMGIGMYFDIQKINILKIDNGKCFINSYCIHCKEINILDNYKIAATLSS